MFYFFKLNFAQNTAKSYHITFARAHCLFHEKQGQVVRKPVSANPGLKFNRGINFSSIKMLCTAHDLCGSRLVV